MGVGVQNPDLYDKGKVTRSAIKDQAQAFAIACSLESDNRTRTNINAEIVARHTGKPPHQPKDLEDAGQNWRSNFPTLSLMGIEGRVTSKLVGTVDNLRTLTNSKLPDDVADSETKSKVFQDKVTSYIRQWKGWRPFISSLCVEDVLIGYACPALTDDYNWRPRLFRSDEAFLPQGCAQFPEFVQTVALKQSFLIHEAVDWIQNKESSEVSGFNVDNVVGSVNKAIPKNPLLDEQGQGNLSRTYQDMIREGNIGMSYSTGAKGIDTFHVMAIEPDTKEVTHYILDRNNEHNALFFRKNRFKSMADVLCLFTLEPGNSTYYGSKGAGRKCVNITTAMDITANDLVDNFRVSMLNIIHTDSKGGISTQIKVINPFIMVSTDGKMDSAPFPSNTEGGILLYSKLGDILEAAMGEYLPNQLSPDEPGQDKTATADKIDYQREQEAQTAFIARFLGQLFEMIQPMQRRLCDSETTDEQAKKLQEELITAGLTKEEISQLSESPTAEVVQDMASQKNQQITAIAQMYAGNPNVDQMKLMERNITALSSPQTARELILPDAIDPTSAAENIRQQIIENTSIQAGNPVNVSPRDLDEEHLKVIMGELKQAEPKLLQKRGDDPDLPSIMDNINSALVHASAHVKQWEAKGAKPEQIQPYEQAIQDYDQKLMTLAKMLQHVKAMQPSGMPAQGPQGAMVAPNGQGQPAPDPSQQKPAAQTAKESISIAYKDAPPSIQRQMEAAAGFTPATEDSATGLPPAPPTSNPLINQVHQIATAPQPPQVNTSAPTP